MKQALKKLMASGEEQQEAKDSSQNNDHEDLTNLTESYDVPTHPTVGAEVQSDGSIIMDLSIPVGGIPLMFTFHFSVLERKQIDVLESSVNDAKDDDLSAYERSFSSKFVDPMDYPAYIS